jgi:hypothetical protein
MTDVGLSELPPNAVERTAPATAIDFPFVASPADLTAEWITDLLRSRGLLDMDNRITEVSYEFFGAGNVGDTARFTLGYANPDSCAPRTLVGKFARASFDLENRHIESYITEVYFYKNLSHRVTMNSPVALYVDIEPATRDFALIMLDESDAVPGDQSAGVDLVQAELALLQAARLHAAFWGAEALREAAGLGTYDDAIGSRARRAGAYFPEFRDRFSELLPSEILDTIGHLAQVAGPWAQDQGPIRALIHADFRPDNMLFKRDHNGTLSLVVVDWQGVMQGPPLHDVAYFVGGAVFDDARRRHEQALVRGYHDELLRLGISDFTWDECWTQYRHHSFAGLLVVLMAAESLASNPQLDAMLQGMAIRHAAHVRDLNAEQLLSSYE